MREGESEGGRERGRERAREAAGIKWVSFTDLAALTRIRSMLQGHQTGSSGARSSRRIFMLEGGGVPTHGYYERPLPEPHSALDGPGRGATQRPRAKTRASHPIFIPPPEHPNGVRVYGKLFKQPQFNTCAFKSICFYLTRKLDNQLPLYCLDANPFLCSVDIVNLYISLVRIM